MTIPEMHVWFRQYAQQMGMQNTRAILPEQIDLLINSSITDTVNQVITQNIGITNDRVITDNSKIGQINALRSLYKVKTIQAIPANSGSSSTTNPFIKGEETHILRMYADIKNFDNGGSGSTGKFDYLYLVDLAINYSNLNSTSGSPTTLTNYFPVRLIDDAYLADTLNDFVLRPRLRTPVAVLYNDQLDLYIDNLTSGKLPENLNPYKLRVSYIAKPAVVAYKSDLGGIDVNCNLPEYMHVDILKHAVDLYRIAVSGALSASQQAEQNQQRENTRNNYRNEGNQQQ
uniref:Capsid protein n=1 Tax=Geladintestivirus 5 TaxID=3233137 RepID=A0AAU8MKB4_9CAUD